jgi:hypothetical protein
MIVVNYDKGFAKILQPPAFRNRPVRTHRPCIVSLAVSLTADFDRAQRAPTLRSAARPIASLHGSLKEVKCLLMHSKIRPALGLMAGHCSWISAPQDSRTAASFTSAALQGSVKSWKCALMHSMSELRPSWAGAQEFVTSRLHASMTVTYWPKAGDTESSAVAKAK